jgi:hypothetical protein
MLFLDLADHVPCHVPERGSGAAPSLFKSILELIYEKFEALFHCQQ